MARYIISGGGTGGHIYPAIAIAKALEVQDKEAQILFVGALGKMEMQKVPQAGYKIEGLPVAGIQRKLTLTNILKNLMFPFKLLASLNKAANLIKAFKPDVVIGVGGYASGPVLLKAQQLGIPTLIQEQNSYAGLTNKRLAQKAKKICVAYPDMERFFAADKLIFTGNPIRPTLLDVAKIDQSEARRKFSLEADRPVILSIGGSLGARTINDGLLASYKQLLQAGYQLIWQTGKSGYESVKAQLLANNDGQMPAGLTLLEFIQDMDQAYAAADLIISRAGALSVSELTIVGKPAILVPSPNVAEDHQTKNAMALVSRQAALLIKDQQFADQIVAAVQTVMTDQTLNQQLAANIKTLAKPGAADIIATEVISLVKQQ